MYTFDSRIRYSETGPDGLLTPEALIDYFQDCSTFQSEDLGIGIRFLKEQGLAWLVNYWQIDVDRYPALGEQVRTGTSPYQLKGFMGLRNFMMETRSGISLAKVNSVWSLVDMRVMHPARILPVIEQRYTLYPKMEMEYLPRKIRVPAEGGEAQPMIPVQPFHLDSNNHMNNAQYLRIAFSFLPAGTRPSRIRIMYQKQAVLGDEIIPVVYRDDGKQTTLVALNDREGSPYAVAELTQKE